MLKSKLPIVYNDENRVKPFYQAIHKVSGQVVAMEALARIEVDGIWVSAADHIMELENNNRIAGFDLLMWEMVIADVTDNKFDCNIITINTSPLTLVDDFAIRRINQLVDSVVNSASDFAPKIVLEITETGRVAHSQKLFRNLKRLQGVEICIDDFGSGYNCLGLLTNINNVAYIKFSSEITLSSLNFESLFKFITKLADRNNVQIVFEGVETLEQKDRLLSYGDVWMQGWLFSKPMAVENVCQRIVA